MSAILKRCKVCGDNYAPGQYARHAGKLSHIKALAKNKKVAHE